MNLKSLFFLFTILIAHGTAAQSLYGDRVKAHKEWNQLFIKNNGWFGGDGIFAIPLDGKEFVQATENTQSLILFSDTMIGTIKDSTVKPGDFSMIHNSVAILQGNKPVADKMEFYWTSQDGSPHAIFDPNTPMTKAGDYYWLGDGFVNTALDNTLFIFGYRIRNTDHAVFGFEQVGTTLIAIPAGSNPPFEAHKQYDTPLFFENEGIETTLGSAILVNTEAAGAPNPDGFVYVYGVRGQAKQMVVARVLPEKFLEFDAWQYWDGDSWASDINALKPINQNLSNEFSISPTADGRFILAYQFSGMSNEVAVQYGSSPVGPFFPVRKVWNTAEVYEDLDFFTYNAKGYPHLSRPGHLLISYNINSFDFWNDILDKPNLYRPRFIEVKID